MSKDFKKTIQTFQQTLKKVIKQGVSASGAFKQTFKKAVKPGTLKETFKQGASKQRAFKQTLKETFKKETFKQGKADLFHYISQVWNNTPLRLNIFLCLGLFFVDQVSKYFALKLLSGPLKEGFLGFSLQEPIKNYNLILGLSLNESNLPLKLSLSAIFSMFLFYYVLFLFHISKNFRPFHTGVSLIFAGFAGNLINKLFTGYVPDFIRWAPLAEGGVYFNLADLFQTAGWFWIAFQFIFFEKGAFFSKDKRKQLFIMQPYQLELFAYSSLVFFSLMVCFLLINNQFVALLDFELMGDVYQKGRDFLKYAFILLCLFSLFIAAFFLYLSNKIYGPIYAFERHVRQILAGEDPGDLRLRKRDQMRNLEDLAKALKGRLQKKEDK